MISKEYPVKRYLKPTQTFYFVHLFLILAPTAYIAFSDYYSDRWYHHSISEYRRSANLALIVTVCFIVAFTMGRFTWVKRLRRKSVRRITSFNSLSRKLISIPTRYFKNTFYLLSKHRLFYFMGIVSSILVWIVFLTGGYDKLARLGEDISKIDYRLIGADDRDRVLTAIIQIGRRLTLPFCVVYFIILGKFSKVYSRKYICFIVLSMFVGILMTLDRGPFMLFIVLFVYIKFCTLKRVSQLARLYIMGAIGIFLVAGTVTFIQHNITDFKFEDITAAGQDFLVTRVFLAPNFVPIELSYGIFDADSEKLKLEHARLIALLTGSYVGTLGENSIYVGPVGAIADIWRNFGYLGVFIIGYLMGVYFSLVESLLKVCDPVMQVAGSFTIITLVFYMFYGTFFSQGVFLQLGFTFVILKFTSRDGRIFTR